MAFRIIVYNCVLMSFNRALLIYIACFIILVAVLIGVSATVSNGPRVDTLRTMASRTAGRRSGGDGFGGCNLAGGFIQNCGKNILLPLNFAHWRRQSAAKKHHQTLLTALRALILGDEKKSA